jgi:hypothetical protein
LISTDVREIGTNYEERFALKKTFPKLNFIKILSIIPIDRLFILNK